MCPHSHHMLPLCRLTIQGNVTATHSPMNDTVDRLNKATDEYKTRMAAVPAQLRLAPWFGNLERGVAELMEGATKDIAVSSYCSNHCLDMSSLAGECSPGNAAVPVGDGTHQGLADFFVQIPVLYRLQAPVTASCT